MILDIPRNKMNSSEPISETIDTGHLLVISTALIAPVGSVSGSHPAEVVQVGQEPVSH